MVICRETVAVASRSISVMTYTEFIVFHQSGNHPQPITVSQGFCRIKRSFHLFIRWLTISGF
jgi:hypothetical protein